MLVTNKRIGSSLRLICQNHADVFTDVANYSDFDEVPEGGCKRKCEYRLPCGHSCDLLCHPYNPNHEKFKCRKPCIKTCEEGHPCQKICFQNCKPCPVLVEKILSRCGHNVTTQCGKNEFDIKCLKACVKSCKENHPCPKKCFENCGFCEVHVERLLSRCGHKITTFCGESESGIQCLEACKEICEEGHPCPKKCFDVCGSCNVMVNIILPKCKHTVRAACWENIDVIKCENRCKKSCPNNHLCQKKCFEICGPCEVIVAKTLNACGHIMKVPCSKKGEIKCILPCKKMLLCSHQCKNKCSELCEEKCLQVINTQSPVCGHSFDVECCFANDSVELAKRCLEPCRIVLPCGHVCKGNCNSCKQGDEHIVCKETCRKLLMCGHLCSNECTKPCVENCKKMMQISSSVCGHPLNIECYLSENLNELSKRCFKSCKKTLQCGHKCRGKCGSCYQGRLHVSCTEPCNRILICGHKCESKCSISCPPCKKPCENRCTHLKCRNKCGDPCVKCFRFCNWSCSHKKCTRRCSEICDRNPCDERCLKKLPCNHQCVGFCGEPCPEECFVCDKSPAEENFSTKMNEKNFGFVYLEDCKHVIRETELRIWLTSKSSLLHELKPKTCPQCGTIIRMNSRFNKIIKTCIEDVEKVKQVTLYNKDKNLTVQRNLLKHINESCRGINDLYSVSVIKVLSGGRVRDIHELTNLENIMNIAEEIELKSDVLYAKFPATPFIDKMIVYMRCSREWMIDFIRRNAFHVSENQLQQLSQELYRMSLLSFLVRNAKQEHFDSLPPEFEKCASSLMNFNALSDENIDFFKKHIKSLVKNMKDIPVRRSFPQEVVSMSAQWYQCPEDHITCLPNRLEKPESMDCYKCRKVISNEKLPNSSTKIKVDVENNSEALDDSDIVKSPEEENKQISKDITEKYGRFFRKNERNMTVFKSSKYKGSNIFRKQNPNFRRNSSSTAFAWKFQLERDERGFSRDNALCKSSEGNSLERDSYPVRTYKKPISKNGLPSTEKNGDDRMYPNRKESISRMPKTFQEPPLNVSRHNTERRKDEKFYTSNKSRAKAIAKDNVPGKNDKNSDGMFHYIKTPKISRMPRIFKQPNLNVSRNNSERKDGEMSCTSTKPFMKSVPKDNFPGNKANKSSVPAKTLMKFATKDNGSQKNSEKKDDERL